MSELKLDVSEIHQFESEAVATQTIRISRLAASSK